ncbi:MAG TPA: 16S rRNA (guanine(527)-N(7))-methyltransferase RsmG [Polyangiaceae bacterium]|jgi:16S rRNA (guanine527-N7)-methyltransferase|nr:16S rRNA (guanine(527)-N(7))-methyltransferase RsmG [Polyangiaceae bacterium]
MALRELGPGWTPLLERLLAAFPAKSALDPGFLERAARYLDLVVSWNARMDLTAAKSAEELVDLSFADAAAIFACGALVPSTPWVDVGSGAGAPGLPLALLEPRLAMTLLEPMQKRVAFLRTAVGTLASNAQVVRGRVEELPERAATVAISRATLSPDEWLAAGARVATEEVWVLLARETPPELAGWPLCTDLSFEWPLTRKSRRAAAFRRNA